MLYIASIYIGLFFFFHEVTISDYEGRVFLFLGERIMLLALNIESFELKA